MRSVVDVVADVPVVLLIPDEANGPLVLWLSHLGGSADKERPTMERFVRSGRAVLSLDAVGHGRRTHGQDPWELAQAMLASFRRRMWPLLGQTVIDAMSAISWAQDRLDQPGGDVVAGGISMGGDVAVALALVDRRVQHVVTVGSTPDWQRPGMRELSDPQTVIDQGDAEPTGQWLRDRFDPMAHVADFPAIPVTFELGDADHHVPAGNAAAFRAALTERDPQFDSLVTIRRHDGLDHLGVTTSEEVVSRAVAELAGA